MARCMRYPRARSTEGGHSWGPFLIVFKRILFFHPGASVADVEDAVAQAIADWWERFRTVGSPGLFAWVAQRAMWRLLDLARSRPTRCSALLDAAGPDGPVKAVEKAEVAKVVRTVLGDGEVFLTLWRWASGFSAEEIARELGVTAGTVRKRVERAIRLVRRHVTEPGHAACHTLACSNVIKCGTADGGDQSAEGLEVFLKRRVSRNEEGSTRRAKAQVTGLGIGSRLWSFLACWPWTRPALPFRLVGYGLPTIQFGSAWSEFAYYVKR